MRRLTHKHPDGRALKWLRRFGAKSCLLSWLPIVGDPICAVAGWMKLPFWPCLHLHDHRQVRPLLRDDGGAALVFPGAVHPLRPDPMPHTRLRRPRPALEPAASLRPT
jgi:hypothetical protein